jgi:hypothetical protein
MSSLSFPFFKKHIFMGLCMFVCIHCPIHLGFNSKHFLTSGAPTSGQTADLLLAHEITKNLGSETW